MTKQRVEALTDGICSIVMTLLVLELMGGRLAEARTAPEVNEALAALWPKVASFIISFVITAIFWVGHHSQFHWVRRTDRRHLWLNMLFLLALSALPFSAALLGEHPTMRTVVMLYGANVICAGGALLGQWRYASRNGLLAADLPARLERDVYTRLLVGQALYWGALLVALWRPGVAFVLFVLYAAAYVVVQWRPEDRPR